MSKLTKVTFIGWFKGGVEDAYAEMMKRVGLD